MSRYRRRDDTICPSSLHPRRRTAIRPERGCAWGGPFGILASVSDLERRERGGPRTLDVFLLAEGLVSEPALRQAVRTALRRRVALVEVVVDENTVDEARLAETLAQRLRIPRLPLSSLSLDEEALREVPHDLAAAYLVVPTRLDSGGERRTLQLAMANPLDAAAIEDVAQASGCEVEPAVATLGEIRGSIHRAYYGMITKMIPRGAGPRDAGSSVQDELPAPGEPTTAPHLQLPDERSVDLRLRALVELLAERGLLTPAELDERVRRLVRGDDV